VIPKQGWDCHKGYWKDYYLEEGRNTRTMEEVFEELNSMHDGPCNGTGSLLFSFCLL
jgi:hypothetical protein